MNLHDIANSPGYGSGKRARDQLAAVADLRAKLPEPGWIPPVMASTDSGANWLIASFGNSNEDGKDWHLVTDHVRASEAVDIGLMQDAKTDAEIIAAIVNAYRTGVLVVADTQ